MIYRTINHQYKEHYDYLLGSGLYDHLVQHKYIVPHSEVEPSDLQLPVDQNLFKVIRPTVTPFLSYPYEWCFSSLKDAALLTLKIQRIALKYGMSLKDATPYNILYHNLAPIFIDTLSFEKYTDSPWTPYNQFCKLFLAPLLLMSYVDISLNSLLKNYIDGIPLQLASSLLPLSAKFRPSIFIHIILHAYCSKQIQKVPKVVRKIPYGLNQINGLIDSLEKLIKALKPKSIESEWSTYYKSSPYSKDSFNHKCEIVGNWLRTEKPDTIWDFGAHNGHFSRLAPPETKLILSIENEMSLVEENYQISKKEEKTNVLPLCIDLVNPSPKIGWANLEKLDLPSRGRSHLLLCLGLLHHLIIAQRIPASYIARFFSQICHTLILEYVSESDPQVQAMLNRSISCTLNYSQEIIENAFSQYFELSIKTNINNSKRILYRFYSKK